MVLAGVPVVIAVAFAVVVLCLPSGPPEFVVSGVVTDAATGTPIAGAKVFDDGYGPQPSWEVIQPGHRARWGAITDSQGRHSFFTWAEHHCIGVEAHGYISQRKSLYESHFTLQKEPEEVINFGLRAK